MFVRVSIATLVGSVVLISALHAQPVSALKLRRGALVAEERDTAYVAKPNATIEAIDLASGRTLWASADAAVPLGADDRYVVAQIEEEHPDSHLRLAVLDVENGRKISESSIELPSNVRALVGDGLGKSFRATVEREGNVLVVSWFFKAIPVRAMAVQPAKPHPLTLVEGTARVNAQTGDVISAAAASLAAIPEKWRSNGSSPRPPWRSGNIAASVDGGRGGPLTLKRSNVATGAALPDRLLSKNAVTTISSLDQHHLLAAERVGAGGEEDPEYRWVIFAMETGDRITELRRDVSAGPFFLWKDNVVFESPAHGFRSGGVWVDEPLQIRAVRASSGSPVWTSELRDLEYRGPLPPGEEED